MSADRQVHKFSELKLSARTLKGLSAAGYVKPTPIQKLVIPRALKGSDIVASAKTGSGKTLAFVVPALELLHRQSWCRDLGLGALVVSPTRELALQIFREFRRVGLKHRFSLGLVTGGYHDVKEQGARVGRMNILVATPGRIVQHLSERPDLSTDNLKLLVLDEADRILHMGFKTELDALLDYLPPERQTLLFSATQTRSVQDLVRLKMRQPEGIDDESGGAPAGQTGAAVSATPDGLRQAYVTCQSVSDKPRYLWQFITGNRQGKCIVFFATCKQVRFFYELMLKLRPGVRVLQLHGGMSQRRRTAVYEEFSRCQRAALLCTDLASRGLDFPSVGSVLQLDCPPDLRTYVHRVGRTARLSQRGRAVVLLLPWEAAALPPMLAAMRPPAKLEAALPGAPVKWDIQVKMAGLVAADPQLRGAAERALRAYVKAYACFAELKQVFQANRLDLVSLARSYGLVQVPKLPKSVYARGVARPGAESAAFGDGESEEGEVDGEEGQGEEDEDSDGGGFLTAKATVDEAPGERERNEKKPKKRSMKGDGETAIDEDEADEETEGGRRKRKSLTRARMAKRILAKGIRPYRRTVFDEETGDAVSDPRLPTATGDQGEGDVESGGLEIEEAKRLLAEADPVDKRLQRELLRKRHREAKAKARARAAKATEFAAKRRRIAATGDGEDNSDDDEEIDEGSEGSSGSGSGSEDS